MLQARPQHCANHALQAAVTRCSDCSALFAVQRLQLRRSVSAEARRQTGVRQMWAEQGKGDVPLLYLVYVPLTARCRALRQRLWRSAAHSEARRRTIRAVDLVRTSLGTVHSATSVCGRREHARTHTKIHARTRAHTWRQTGTQCALQLSAEQLSVGWSAPFIHSFE